MIKMPELVGSWGAWGGGERGERGGFIRFERRTFQGEKKALARARLVFDWEDGLYR